MHLESKVIKLKQDALRLMNIALAGTACGQILTLFEFAFGYPESKESKTRGQQLEELERHFIDDEPPTEEDTISKTEDEKEAATQFDPNVPRAKNRQFGQCRDELKDLVPLDKAMPIIPSTSVKLSETGIPRSYYSDREASEGQSIYRCLLTKLGTGTPCSYYAAQMAAVTTHLHRKHLKLCLKCRLCDKKSYSANTMSLHLKTAHKDQSADWFEPTPPLEGDTVEITDQILAKNLQEIEGVTSEPTEEPQDS